jgi:hypothetical protein
MSKLTKRNRRNRIHKKYNKTKKYLGGSSNDNQPNTNNAMNNNATTTSNITPSKGIFDIIGAKVGDYAGKTFNYVKEKGLRLAGLEPIKKEGEQLSSSVAEDSTKKVDDNMNQLSDAASGLVSGAQQIGSDVVKVFDKGSAALVGNINDVLGSPKVENSISGAVSETAEIGEKLLEKINDKLNTPELKAETAEALNTVAGYTDIAVKAMDKPINNAIDELNEAGTKAASGIASGAVKVGTDVLAAVPGFGAVIELGKMANDASAAAGDVVAAASDATSTISKVVEETSENIEQGLEEKKKLEELQNPIITNTTNTTNTNNTDTNNTMKGGMAKLKEMNKDGVRLSNRINKSINEFENPLQNTKIGGGSACKTRRGLFKNRQKTKKRVRFAI